MLDNASSQVQALGNGDTASDSFTVASVDGTTRTVTVTINGTNDAPMLAVGAEIGDDLSGGYSGASGSPNIWTTNWTETGDDGAANGGDITHRTDYAFNQYIELIDSDDASSSIARTLDLTGMTSATLTFDYQRVQLESADDRVIVEVSSDGVNFTQIGVIGGGAFDDATFQTASFDISAYASATTTIRFTATDGLDYGGGDFDWVRIDNVNVAYSGPATFTEGGVAVAIVSGIDVADIDDANLRSATVVLANAQAGDELRLFGTNLAAGGNGTLFGMFSWTAALSAGALTVTFTGNTAKANWEYLLESLTFRNTSDQPSAVDRQFEITVGDGDANSNVAHATIKVDSIDELPMAVGDTVSVAEDAGPVAIDIFANDTDSDGGPKTITSVTQSAHGALVITGGGTGLTFQPAANFSGDTSFSYTLNGGSTATVNVTVTPVADQPAINVAVSDPTPTPTAAEFRVNTFTGGISQNSAAVTALSDGRFLVTWVTRNQISADDMFAQIYNADGTPYGSEFVVNTTTGSYERFGSIAGLDGGGFVATYSAYTLDGNDYGIFGQRYDATGARIGGEFQINNLVTAGSQYYTSVSELAGGGFVVTWYAQNADGSDFGIQARIYNASGVAQGSEFAVNTQTAGAQTIPEVIGLTGGGFVIAWQSPTGIYAQMYSSTGTRVGGEFLVNSNAAGAKTLPDIAALEDGGFVISWTSPGQDGSSDGVYAQRYASDGTTVGGEFLVNTYVSDKQTNSTVIGLADGGFLISWVSTGQDGSGTGIYGQRFGADGSKVGTEFRISGSSDGNQYFDANIGGAEIVQLADGSLVASWAGVPSIAGDEIYARQFNLPGLQNNAEDSAVSIPSLAAVLADTDGSETLAVLISSIPAGAVLSDGSHSFAASAGQQSVDVTGWNLAHLTITPVANYNGTFDLTVTATATETANGDSASRTITIPVTVEAVNDAPNLSGVDDVTFLENSVNAAPQLIDADVAFGDVDSANLAGGTLTVAGFVSGEDTIGIRNQGTGAGEIGVSGANVTYGGVVIGTFTGGSGANDLVVTFNAAATPAAADALIQNLTYANASDTPTADRTLTITVTDGDGGSVAATTTVSVTPESDVPVAIAHDDTLSSVPDGWNWFSGNGHIYKFLGANILWADAVTAAAGQLPGASYLATSTSAAEDSFIDSLVSSGYRVHLGASDEVTEGTWVWVTGPEANTAFWANGAAVNGAFTDWGGGGPSGSSPGGFDEDYLSTDLSKHWNDVAANNSDNNIGYVAEAGAPGATYAAIGEDAAFTFSAALLLANDGDAPASLLSVSATSAKGAVVSYDPGTGEITYDPTGSAAVQGLGAGETTTDTFAYTIDDGSGGTSTATVTVTVAGANDAPVGANGLPAVSVALQEDVTRVFTLADFFYKDADGDAMAGVTISGLSIGSGLGTLLYGTTAVVNNQFISAADIAAGMLSFAPADDVFSGSGSFSFKVKDANGASDATARVMSLDFDGVDRGDITLSNGPYSSDTVSGSVGYVSYKDLGSTFDSITVGGAPSYSSLNFLKSGNNLEIGWTYTGGGGNLTLLDQFVYTSDSANNVFETFNLSGNYGQFGLPATYVLSLAFDNTSAVGRVIVAGTNGNDTLSGGTYGDLLFGNGSADTLDGNGGNDLLVGGLGNDLLRGGDGADTYLFGLIDGDDTIFDLSGSPDRIVIKTNGAAMSELIASDNHAGATGDLIIHYNGQSITVQGEYDATGHAVNTINFDGGSVYGYALGASDYTFDGHDGGDPRVVDLGATSTANFIAGEQATANVITGGLVNDLIFGGGLGDTLAGGNGNNLIVGGKGNDTLSAGNGNDVYVFGLADGTDIVTDGGGIDRVFIDSNGAALSGLSAYDDNAGTTAGNLVVGYNGQQITVSNHFTGAAFGAIETIEFDGGSVYGYDLGTGAYNISKSDLADNGGAQRVVDLSASSADNFIAGELATASAITGGNGRDIVFGGDQADTLAGGGGSDLLIGGAGGDILLGGPGNDVLAGGAGADHFRFNAPSEGLDSILDFSSGEGDLIEILGSAFGNLSVGPVAGAAFEQVSGNVDASAKAFVFDTTTDTLYWNADGAGGQAAVALAHLENGHDVTAADLRIV